MTKRLSLRAQALALALGSALCACGGGSSSAGGTFTVDEGRLVLGDDGLFFVDANRSGRGASLRLEEVSWARLVDLYDVDAGGARSARPIQRDLPVDPNLQDGVDYRLEAGALGVTDLVILHPRGSAEFESALRVAAQDLPVLEPKAEADSPPCSMLPRNAAVVLRFDDLLDDGPDARIGLGDSVRAMVGYPPVAVFRARVLFDASHGGLADGIFHSTRVIFDPTLTSADSGGDPAEVNLVGFPDSSTTSLQSNLSIRLATKEDFGSGHFYLVRNLRGRPLDPGRNDKVDGTSPTLDVVRAVRSGNPGDPHNGFLLDQVPPTIVGRWRARITAAEADPAREGGFLVRFAFDTACAEALETGELIETGAGYLEVSEPSPEPDVNGEISRVVARSVGSRIPSPAALLGTAHLWTSWDADSSVPPACFVEVQDTTSLEPDAPVHTGASFLLRFSEPMDPASLDPLETVRLFSGSEATATSTVVGRLRGTQEATTFLFEPILPLDHVQGTSESYSFEFLGGPEGPSDLSGNALESSLPTLEFRVDPAEPASSSGGLTLRFRSLDEYVVHDTRAGAPDLRGQFTLDSERGVLRPRPVQRASWPIDGSTPITSLMFPLPVSVQEPLVPLGSRFQTLWRYADIGWNVVDESRYDLDVEGVAWMPFAGSVVSDFFPKFEMRLGHAVQLPDEIVNSQGALLFPTSGLLDAPAAFDDNVLESGGARPVNVRSAGYRVDQTRVFQSTTGSQMMPYPVARPDQIEPFTWRDTSIQELAGFGGQGIPLSIEKMVDPSIVPGSVAGQGQVPSFGLPLLVEIRCFPADTAIGQNGFKVAIPAFGQLFPSYRVHSSGGINTSSTPTQVDPDTSPVPRGGFDPNSSPPGLPSRSADPALYFGQLDTVTRVTRVISVWFDTESSNPDYFQPLVSPLPAAQPAGTAVQFEFRGATSFQSSLGAELDADRIDAYGELLTGRAIYPDGRGAWSSEIDDVDGLRYLQVRMTFVNNIETGLSPELDSLALPFTRR